MNVNGFVEHAINNFNSVETYSFYDNAEKVA